MNAKVELEVEKSKEEPAEFTIRGIPFFLLERFWPFALPYIKRALDHTAGEINSEDIKQYCIERNMQLWLIIAHSGKVVGASTTEIIKYPQRRICRIVTLGGSGFSSWIDFVEPVIEAWAIEQGCDGIEAWVRRGFVSILKERNYKPKFVSVIRDLPKESHNVQS